MDGLNPTHDTSQWSSYDREMDISIGNWVRTVRLAQIEPPGDWRIWLLLAGRGFGKTRTAAEACKMYAWFHDGSRTGVFAPTVADGRDVCFEGESGLCNIIPPNCIEVWNRSIGELRLVNGSQFRLFSADEPDRARGYQFHRAWADELASFRGKISKKDAAAEGVSGTPVQMFRQIELATRLPPDPRILITTTPRPLAIFKDLMSRPNTRVSTGTTYENAEHLASAFIQSMRDTYEGTRVGRQELFAELLEDIEGALWNRVMIDATRLDPKKDELPEMIRIVVGIDPAVTANKRSNETGIVVAGRTSNGRMIVLEDCSGKYSPEEWARRAVRAYEAWKADCIVAEKNNGGDLVRTNMRAAGENLPLKLVDATKGKIVRAEPVSQLYERQKASHWGALPRLEDQMCAYTGEEGEVSPDRLDALVWAATELMLKRSTVLHVAPVAMPSPNYWDGSGMPGVGIEADDFIQASY